MGTGFTWERMAVAPLADKWRAFFWEVLEVDGHDVAPLLRTLHTARYAAVHGKPIVLIARTVKGKGIAESGLNYSWHTGAGGHSRRSAPRQATGAPERQRLDRTLGLLL